MSKAAKLIAFYSQPENPEDFDKQYFETHLPLAQKMPGLARVEVSKLTKNIMGGDLPHYMMAELTFDSMDALNNALKSPEGQAAGANLMSFASKYVTMTSSEVSVIEGAGVY